MLLPKRIKNNFLYQIPIYIYSKLIPENERQVVLLLTKDNFPPLTQSDLNRLKTLNKDFINRNSQTIIKLIETNNIEVLSLKEDFLEYKLSQKTIS